MPSRRARTPLRLVSLVAALAPATAAVAQDEVFREEIETSTGSASTDALDRLDEHALEERLAGPQSGEGAEQGPGVGTWYPIGEAPEERALFSVETDASAQLVSFDDADLMALDESSMGAIQDTDDRTTFGRTWMTITGVVAPVEQVAMDVTLAVGASWGGVLLDSAVALGAASVDARIVDTDAFDLSVRAGRQRFGIGGAPVDYYLDGMVDGFTVEAEAVDVMTLRVLAFDLFFPQEYPEYGHSVFYSRPQAEAPAGQRGETNTIRTGAVLQTVDQLVEGLDVRAFFFHASVGGTDRGQGSGSDISEGGLLGNFRDRDYVQLYGARAGYTGEVAEGLELGGFVEFARSSGIDRKEMTAVDVDLGGNAMGVGVGVDYDFGQGHVGVEADWHRMDGAQYSVSGLEFQRGFVSMYGARLGGLASGAIAGMRPSATLSRYGVFHAPDATDRAAGTDFVHAALSLGFVDTELELGFWTYADTRTSSFDQSRLADVQPPPEHSREEFAALVRAGRSLGYELDATLTQTVRDYAALFVRGGLFLPGDYYALEVSRSASPVPIEGDGRLGGQETFWAVAAGAEFGFGYRRGR